MISFQADLLSASGSRRASFNKIFQSEVFHFFFNVRLFSVLVVVVAVVFGFYKILRTQVYLDFIFFMRVFVFVLFFTCSFFHTSTQMHDTSP